MGKVIKIILSILSGLLLVSIILPLLVSIALNFETVQNYAACRATQFLSHKVGTEISVGHIDLAPFNRVALQDVYVEDFEGDTLLFASQVRASLIGNGLLAGNFDLGYVEVEDAYFCLVQDSTQTLNLKHVIDKIRNAEKEEKGKFKMSSRKLEIENLNFVLRQHEPYLREEGINFQDLNVLGANISIEDFSINTDSLSMNMKSMAFSEKSGFILDKFASQKLSISNSGIYAEDLEFSSHNSQIFMTYLNLYSGDWEAFADFTQQVVLDARIEKGNLGSQTLAHFAPSLSKWNIEAEDMELEFTGTVDNFSAEISNINIENTKLEGDFAVRGLPDIDNTIFDFSIANLETEAQSVNKIVEGISGSKLSSSIEQKLIAMNQMSFRGRFKGHFTDFEAEGNVMSELGDLDLNLNLKPLEQGDTGFEGQISTKGLEIGKILSSNKLGYVSLNSLVSGIYGHDAISLNTDTKIDKLLFNDYEYTDINVDGLFENKYFVGQVRSNSQDANLEFNGMIDFNDSIPSYNFDLRLLDFNLAQTNFNKRDSISKINCRIIAKASGTKLDDLDGTINIEDVLYISQTDSLHTGSIDLVTSNSEGSKRLNMSSDFADIEFMSSSSYSDMFVYLDRALRNYLPSMSGSIAPKNIANKVVMTPATSDEYYVAKVNLKEIDNIAGEFVPGLQIANGSSAVFMLNPKRDQLSLQVNSDYIEKDNAFIYDLDLDSRNQGDSISLFVRAKEFYASGIYLTDIDIIGGARNNTISLDTRIGTDQSIARAYLSTTTLFTQDSTGLAQVRFKFNPSTVTFNNQEWFLIGDDIVIDTTGVKVGGFNIDGLGQSLKVDGYASRNVEDTLKIKFNNFDISPLSEFVTKSGYSVAGRTSGYINAVSALSTDAIMAEIFFDSVKVNDFEVPNTRFSSQWDSRQKRVSIFVDRVDSGERVINGHFRPSDKRFYAHVNINDLNLSLLDPVMSGVVGSTQGTADTDLVVTSIGSKHNINGKINLDSLRTKVLFTNVDYFVGQTSVEVDNNVLKVSRAKLSDGSGGQGDVNLSFDASNFKNLKYELTVNAKELLALNTEIEDNELFYGTVYADGLVSVKGDKVGSNMYVSARTSGPSELYMPLSGSESASEADFIVFESPREIQQEADDYTRRKRQIMAGREAKTNSSQGNFDMNIQLDVDPSLEFQLVIDPTVGDIIRANGSGTINMNINPRKDLFTMYGDYVIADGSYLFTLRNIINKKFIIEPGGTIQWTGDPVNALLDITAVYKLKTSLAPLLNSSEYSRRVTVDCQIQLNDRLSQPSITFDVAVPNADTETQSLVSNALNTQEMKATQFLWLLAINSFYSDNSSSAYSVNIGTSATAVTGIELLSNQLSNWLSSERFSLVPRYIPSSETSDDEFGFAFSAELIKNKLVIEGEGSYGNDVSSMNNTNFTNDLTAYWLFDQQGSLKAKAFTRTVDDFDENQGLQESGIGLFYSESFDNLKDLASTLKKRFTRKKDDIDEDEDE